MAHAAIGFAKQMRRRQIFAVTSSIGPGALNMVTAAGTATVNRIPVLFLPGDVFACRQPDPVLQQVEQFSDPNVTANDAFKAVSRYWDRVARPEQLMSACINAMRVLTDPAETGAVTLALPQDVQGESYDYPEEFLQKRFHHLVRRAPAAVEIQRAVALITAKRKPLVICGGGVRYSDAERSLETFCAEFNIPFAETQAGKGVVPWDNSWNLGGIGVTGTLAANTIAREADLVLGSRYVPGGGTVNWGLGRKIISRGGSLYARVILGLSVRDLTGGFKCFRREVLEAIDLASVEATGYAFQIELTFRAVRRGCRVVEIPIVFVDRRVGQSKMSKRIVLEALRKVWSIRRSDFR